MVKSDKPIIVMGATGYVGGRLIPQLLEAGYKVRAVSRSKRKLLGRPWSSHPNIEIVAADVLNREELLNALSGGSCAYYLIHSMDPSHKDFTLTDRQAALLMRESSEQVGLERIIYLSGLGKDSPELSKHLRSRAEVAQILSEGSVPVTVFRAAMIIGSGSASFEILRYLVERLPVMVTPRWVNTPSQPIAIRNVIYYLLECLKKPETIGKTFDIGGPEVLTYRELMEIYTEEAGLPSRLIIPVPVFSPRLSSYWIHLITPLSSSIARPLAAGLKNPTVCLDHTIESIIPQELLSCRLAIRLAIQRLQEHNIETHWTDAGVLPPVESVYPGDPNWSGGSVYIDKRELTSEASPDMLWKHVIKIGGETGWYYCNALWRLRGLLDKLFGGVGHRRGRRDPDLLMPGDAIDVWRVLDVVEPKRLVLLAEMKMPGTAILSFELEELEKGKTKLIQTAWFSARGLSGLLYWYAVMPFHDFIFDGMLSGIASATGKPATKPKLLVLDK